MAKFRKSRPRRIKTIADLERLEGKEFYQTADGIAFRTEDISVDAMIRMDELLERFYRFNADQPPLVFRLIDDPAPVVRGAKLWQGIYRGNFYMDIDQGVDSHGPHCCRLWFKCFSLLKASHWIATLQVMAFFFNEEEIKAYVSDAIYNQKFFMLPENRNKPIIP